VNCGSVFSGVGLLDLGLTLAGIDHAWFCERDEWRRGILARRWPGARIVDDVRHVGHDCGRVDLIAGGFPCKGGSTAGKREGFGHAETVLWFEMLRAVRELRPRYVLVENVANLLSLHDGAVWGTVLGGLAESGYGVVWDCVPAAAVGAPHLRDRVFAVATYAESARGQGAWAEREALGRTAGDGAAADASRVGSERGWRAWPGRTGSADGGEQAEPAADADGAASAADAEHAARHGLLIGAQDGLQGRSDGAGHRGVPVEWGEYEPAIRRWEAIHGPAPEPLVRRVDDGDAKLRRVRARVDRSRLSALGDGVQVQVGRLAGEYIAELERRRLAA
jgi:DNA (cytosine-5)-methyltransferase 1